MRKILVFTDLDGSLLSHHDYSWNKAAPALKLLKQQGFPLIINSSKTSAEILKLKQAMGNTCPFVSENGGVIEIPRGYFSADYAAPNNPEYEAILPGISYQEIITTLQDFRDTFHFKFVGFNDMSVEELMQETNLSEEQAQDARQRQASEPIIWLDSYVAFNQFKTYLEDNNLIITAGGRFSHVMSDYNKGDAVTYLKSQYQQAEPDTQWISIGLGDSANDLQMLEAVDYPVLIPNPGSKHPIQADIPHLLRPDYAGPAGWNQAVLRLLDKLL